jgi:hypothetical protein
MLTINERQSLINLSGMKPEFNGERIASRVAERSTEIARSVGTGRHMLSLVAFKAVPAARKG